MKRRVFIDADVLISASKGVDEIAAKAMMILDDPDLEYVSDVFIKLETLPKAVYNKYLDQVEFLQNYFNSVVEMQDTNPQLIQRAMDEASVYGLGGVDAIHIVAAKAMGADEFITKEKPTSSIHRARGISIRSIHI